MFYGEDGLADFSNSVGAQTLENVSLMFRSSEALGSILTVGEEVCFACVVCVCACLSVSESVYA